MGTNPEQLKLLYESCQLMQKQILENQAQLSYLTRQLEDLLAEQAKTASVPTEEPVHEVQETTPEVVGAPSIVEQDEVVAEINTTLENETPTVAETDKSDTTESYDSLEDMSLSMTKEEEPVFTVVEPDKEEPKTEEPRPDCHTRYMESKKDFHTRYMESRKDSSFEMKIGKKLLPIAASALILFAIIMFGKLIQPALSDGMRAGILALVSLAISVAGIVKMKRENKYYNWYAALAGCGVAACYVTSLVSHFVLEVMSQTGLMVSLGVWIVVVMGLSRFKSSMFQYICYVGILVAAAMSVFQWNDTPLGILVYVISISALFALHFSKDIKSVWWYFTQFHVVMAMMALAYHDTVTVGCIFVVIIVVLVGHVIYYAKSNPDNDLLVATTLPALPALYVSRPFNHHLTDIMNGMFEAWSKQNNPDYIALVLVLIAVAALLYRLFYNTKNNYLFWMWSAPIMVIFPLFQYNEHYNHWCGHFLVPAIGVYALGHVLRNGIFRKVAIAYLLLFVIKLPSRFDILLEDGIFIQGAIWIHLMLTSVFLYLSRANKSRVEMLLLLAMYEVSLIGFYMNHWIDSTLLYVLTAGYLIILNTSRIRNSKLLNGKGVLDKIVVPLTFILPFICFKNRSRDYDMPLGTENISFENISSVLSKGSLLEIDGEYSGLIYVLAASLLLLLAGTMRKYKTMIVASYIALPVSMMLQTNASPVALAIVVYLVVLGLMVLLSKKYYFTYGKTFQMLVFAALSMYLFFRHVINCEECWMILSAITLVCVLTPILREEDSEVNDAIGKSAIIVNDILLFFGMMLIRARQYDLYWRGDIDGTNEVMSVLIFVLMFTMAAVSIMKQFRKRTADNENALGVYNGIKFTLLFVTLMAHYSVVSYAISIVLLILSVLFVIGGFRYGIRGLRLYGLGMSMFSVIKLLFFDIEFDNAFYRPVSFLVAGLLLFGISYIYFRIEKSGEMKNEE